MGTTKTTEEQLAKALELLKKTDRHLIKNPEASELCQEIWQFCREASK